MHAQALSDIIQERVLGYLRWGGGSGGRGGGSHNTFSGGEFLCGPTAVPLHPRVRIGGPFHTTGGS